MFKLSKSRNKILAKGNPTFANTASIGHSVDVFTWAVPDVEWLSILDSYNMDGEFNTTVVHDTAPSYIYDSSGNARHGQQLTGTSAFAGTDYYGVIADLNTLSWPSFFTGLYDSPSPYYVGPRSHTSRGCVIDNLPDRAGKRVVMVTLYQAFNGAYFNNPAKVLDLQMSGGDTRQFREGTTGFDIATNNGGPYSFPGGGRTIATPTFLGWVSATETSPSTALDDGKMWHDSFQSNSVDMDNAASFLMPPGGSWLRVGHTGNYSAPLRLQGDWEGFWRFMFVGIGFVDDGANAETVLAAIKAKLAARYPGAL